MITDDGTFENGEKTEQILGNFVESAIEIDQDIFGIADFGFSGETLAGCILKLERYREDLIKIRCTELYN